MQLVSDRVVPERSGFLAGFGRAEITAFEPGFSMWGWGSAKNVPTGAATPLYARAFVLSKGSGRPFILVSFDLGMVSESVRRAVLLGLIEAGVDTDEHRLTLTATHTHSGPSGFSTYLFYACAGPGFSRRVHERIVRGAVEAVVEALGRSRRARVYAHAGDIPLVEPVCVNRSLKAYNRNSDVVPVAADRADEAVNRRMTVLRVDDEHGTPRGLVSFFAVHGTSVHADATLLHSDNKGLAAVRCETEPGLPRDFVALFAQESAGDVSPNYRFDAARGVAAGRYEDDHESAAHNGGIQAAHALRLFRSAPHEGRELKGPLLARLRYCAFHDVAVDADLADGVEGRRTGTAELGIGFSLGTREGPGPLGGVAPSAHALMRLLGLSRVRRDDEGAAIRGCKVPLWELGTGAHNRMGLGVTQAHPLFALVPDRRMRYARRALEYRGARLLPWVPHHLPLQLVVLGDLALTFLPFEPTTQAGRRLRALATAELGPHGVREAVVCGYSNAYSSYLTTPEEYDEQAYEGATTLFGRWSLGAAGTGLRRVAHALAAKAPEADLGEPPPWVPLEQWLPAEPFDPEVPFLSGPPQRATAPQSAVRAEVG